MNKLRFLLPSANTLLLIALCFTIFIVPVFPLQWHKYLYPPAFTCIFLTAAFSIRNKQQILKSFAIGLTVIVWLSAYIDLEALRLGSRALQIAFFVFMVFLLVAQTARTAVVTSGVIADSISGYLLLGFAFCMVVITIDHLLPGAYSIGGPANDLTQQFERMGINIYYTFVTYSTTGYGDIVPVKPYTRSLAIMIGVSGQLYPAIIIAMLVGKYAAKQDAT